MTTVTFTQMKDGTEAEYLLLRELERPHLALTPDRILRELAMAGEETLSGYKITRLRHTLQTATPATRDGPELDWIADALLHALNDGLPPHKHDQFRTAIPRPL